MEPLLELNGVSKAYHPFALREVSLSVEPGYIVGLVGPNGAGKTTMMRLALGLAACDAGRVRVFGLDPWTRGAEVRARIGFVHEAPAFPDYLSVTRTAAMVAAFYPTWDAVRFERLRAEFGVPARVRVRELSRGTRMKLALALALSHGAELLLLDEPTGGLDPIFRARLLDLLSETIGGGRTSVLFSTQIVGDLDRIADYVVLVRDGRVLFAGPKADILDRWAVVRAGDELSAEIEAAGPRGLLRAKHRVEAIFEDLDEARRRFGGRAVVEKATLEDAFLLCRHASSKRS